MWDQQFYFEYLDLNYKLAIWNQLSITRIRIIQ